MFEWDDYNINHIARHNVTSEQAEQAVRDPNQAPAGRSIIDDEEYEAIIGATAEAILLFVVYTIRDSRIRIATARRATSRERQLYTEKS